MPANLEHKAEHNNGRMRGAEPDLEPQSDRKCFATSEGAEDDPFAKPLYGLIPVPSGSPPSPPSGLSCREIPPSFPRRQGTLLRIDIFTMGLTNETLSVVYKSWSGSYTSSSPS